MLVETERLLLEQPTAEHLDDMIGFYLSERAAMAGGNVSYPEAVMRSYAMLGHWVHRGYGMLAVKRKSDHVLVGMSGPYYPPGRPETEVGWILFDGFEGCGYASEAAKAAVQFARQSLGWNDIVHYIDTANVRSIALAERIGAVLDATAQQPKPDKPCLVYRQPKP